MESRLQSICLGEGLDPGKGHASPAVTHHACLRPASTHRPRRASGRSDRVSTRFLDESGLSTRTRRGAGRRPTQACGGEGLGGRGGRGGFPVAQNSNFRKAAWGPARGQETTQRVLPSSLGVTQTDAAKSWKRPPSRGRAPFCDPCCFRDRGAQWVVRGRQSGLRSQLRPGC